MLLFYKSLYRFYKILEQHCKLMKDKSFTKYKKLKYLDNFDKEMKLSRKEKKHYGYH